MNIHCNILYVDDEAPNLRSFNALFRRKYSVHIAESAKEGLEILEREEINVIITDQRMPEVTGVEFLKIVKTKWPHIKLILLTGFMDNEAVKEAINEVGIYWYVNKPFDNEQMDQLIMRAFNAQQVESERDTSEKRLIKILNTATDVILTINDREDIISANPATKILFGYEEDELLGLPISFLISNTLINTDDEDDNGSGDRNIQLIGQAATGKRKDGGLVPIESKISEMELDGENFYTLVIRDISQRLENEQKIKESEEKFRGVFESMVDVFVRVNNEGICELVSPSVYSVLGYKPEEMIGKAIEDIYVDSNDRKELIQRIDENGACNNLVVQVINKQNQKLYVSVNARAYTDEDGNRLGLESMVRDITEVKNAQNKIQQMNLELEQKVKERTVELSDINQDLERAQKDLQESLSKEKELGELKSRFVATASHQFRTPLTVIQSNVDLLEMYLDKLDESLKDKFIKSFARIHKESNRMTDLMNDVLILGKINAGATEINLTEVDSMVILNDLVESMNQLEKYAANVRMEVINEPKKILVDEKQFTHIVQNILSNAQKYSLDRGDVELTVNFREEVLELVIRDKGIGMSDDDVKNLFQPFFRGKNVQSIQGTGLGLSIVHEYVKLNKAEINVKSDLSKGTEIKLSFKYPNT